MSLANQVFFAATNLAQTGFEKEGAGNFLPNDYAKAAVYDTLAISGGGDESFVKNAYKALFNRDGESEGVSFWSNALKSGLDRVSLLDAMSQAARMNNSADSLAVMNTNANYVNEMLLNIFGRVDAMMAANYTNMLNAGLIARSALSAHLNLFGASSGDAGFMAQNVNFINSAYQRLFNGQISNEKLLNFLNYLNAGGDKGEVILAMLDPQSQSADEAKTLENKSIALDEFSKNFYKYNDALSPEALAIARAEATNAINSVTSDTLNPAAVIDNNIATYTAAYSEPSPAPAPSYEPSSYTPSYDPTPTPTPTPTPPEPKIVLISYDAASKKLDLSSGKYNNVNFTKDTDKLIVNSISGDLEVSSGSNTIDAFITTKDGSVSKGADATSATINVYLGGKGEEALIIGNENIELTADKSSWLTDVDNIVVNTTGMITAEKELLLNLYSNGKIIDFDTGETNSLKIKGDITSEYDLGNAIVTNEKTTLYATVGENFEQHFHLYLTEAKDVIDISKATCENTDLPIFYTKKFNKEADSFVMPSNAQVATTEGKIDFKEKILDNITGIEINNGIATFTADDERTLGIEYILEALNTAIDSSNELIVGPNKAVLLKQYGHNDYRLVYTGNSTNTSDDLVVGLQDITELTGLTIDDNHIATIIA